MKLVVVSFMFFVIVRTQDIDDDLRKIYGNSEILSDDELISRLFNDKDYTKTANEKVNQPLIHPKEAQQGCGYRNTDGVGFRILGSKEAETFYGEFPWMAAIFKTEQDVNQTFDIYKCGASIITPEVVMTAAHCVVEMPIESIKVRAGEWDTGSEAELFAQQDRKVTEVLLHPHFIAKDFYRDIALLFLDKPFEYTDSVKSVCLPPPHMEFDHQQCIATGWGGDGFKKNGKNNVILKKVDLPIIPRGVCEEELATILLDETFNLHNSFICAGGEPGKDACEGDGGSPLVCPMSGTPERYYQVGIVAWGIDCGKPIPAVYVNVSKFRKWIDKQLALKNIDISHYTP